MSQKFFQIFECDSHLSCLAVFSHALRNYSCSLSAYLCDKAFQTSYACFSGVAVNNLIKGLVIYFKHRCFKAVLFQLLVDKMLLCNVELLFTGVA